MMCCGGSTIYATPALSQTSRSEEHTSELQSLRHLVCRRPISTLFPYTTLFRSGSTPEVIGARRRGQEYLLERRLFRRLSTGAIVDEAWTRFAFPTWWHYDVLRGLDYLRHAGVEPDEQIGRAHV